MSLSHTFPASCDSDKFGWFGGPVVSSFMVDRGDFFQHVDGEWKCGFLGWLPLFAFFRIRKINMFELNIFFIFAYICSQDFSDQVLTVEPTAECFCFHMFSTSFDSDKFGWFGGAVVSSFIFHRKESCHICRCCKQLWISAWFAKFCIREIHMSELNVMCSPDVSDHDLNSRALDEDASLDLSLFPGLGRGAEDKLVRDEHRFATQHDWRRGCEGLVCGMGSAECCCVSWCYVFGILWQWQVWMVWRSCSFIIHLCSRLVVKYVDAASKCWFLECSCKGSIREICRS